MLGTQKASLPPTGKELDAESLINAAPWSTYQKALLLLIALALLFDGFDNQALALAIPSMMKDWDVAREAFASVISVGFAGMAMGTALGGTIGDRFGRKPALVGSVLIFGLLTAAIAASSNLTELKLLRFFGGLGLGGAVPNAAALISETTPAHRRNLAVTLGTLCVGLGGLVGSLAAAWILPAFGWRHLFLIAGAIPIVIAVVQFFLMPESPRYLAGNAGQGEAASSVLRRFGIQVPRTQRVVDESRDSRTGPATALFAPSYRRDTIGIWFAFFFTLFSLYSLISWLPSIFAAAGFEVWVTSAALAAYNLGGVVGALAGVWAIGRYGSRWPLTSMAAGGATGAAALALTGLDASRVAPVLALVAFEGLCIGGLQIMLYSVGAHIYEPAVRATGLGWAVGFGRVGAIISPLVASTVITFGGGAGLFASVAAFMVASGLAVLFIRRHTPKSVQIYSPSTNA